MDRKHIATAGDKMELHGVTGAPYKHPTVRRKIPAPFTRPSINAGGQPVKRVWKDTPVIDVKKGDTVANFGVVESAVEFIRLDDQQPWRIRLYNVMGKYRDFGGHERLYAFSPDPHE